MSTKDNKWIEYLKIIKSLKPANINNYLPNSLIVNVKSIVNRRKINWDNQLN